MNKNKFKLQYIIKHDSGESIVITGEGKSLVLQYIPEAGDPVFNDLPSELLTIGEDYHVNFEPVKKEDDDEFNEK